MCIIVSCSARATCGALRWRGPGGSRPWPGRRRWARAAASGSGSPGSGEAACGRRDRGRCGPRRSAPVSEVGRGAGRWTGGGGGDEPGAQGGRGGGEGRAGEEREGEGGRRSPDPVVLRRYRLGVVLGLGGGGKARGVSGLNGESPTLRGLLGTHVQAPGRSARGGPVRALRAPGAPSPRRARAPSPAGGRGQSQAGRSCRSPGRGGALRSRRGRAGVCGAGGRGRRRGGLHCDPGPAR